MKAPVNDGPYQEVEGLRETFEAWFAERPPAVQQLVTQCPPFYCYRLVGDDHVIPGHYTIAAYNEGGFMLLVHGGDSFLPGLQVSGVPPEHLQACNCGNWEPANDAQLAQTNAFLEHEIALRDAARKQN